MTAYNRIERLQAYWRYEVTIYRGDDIIDHGTIKDVAERRGIRKDTIYWYTTPTGQRRADKRKDQSKTLRVILV